MADSGGPKLGQLYDQLWANYQYLETSDDSSTGQEYQATVTASLEKAEQAIGMVNELAIFSDNEDLDEIATNELRFLTLSTLAGYFSYKINNVGSSAEKRLESLEKSRRHWTNFLKLCRNYGLTDKAPDSGRACKTSARAGSQEEIVEMAHQRRLKIDRFKARKEEEEKLKDLYEKVKLEHVDDEIKREYYTTSVRKFINDTLENLEAVEREIPMLKRMVELGGPGRAKPPEEPTAKPAGVYRTPFILTKDDLQKRVFGMGYTNLPTYSIEEFYEKEAAAGRLPVPGEMPANPTPDQVAQNEESEEVEKEGRVEKDDEETLRKQRGWDDWKDDHRRGWGNRQNMG